VTRRLRPLERIALAITPGGYDLATNQWMRAYAAIFVAGFVLLPIAAKIQHPQMPAVGVTTANAYSNFELAFPMPFDAKHPTPFDYARSTIRWTLPYARIFWPAVVVMIAALLATHLRRLPRIFRRHADISQEIPTVITATES
jgi:hypothetical protein